MTYLCGCVGDRLLVLLADMLINEKSVYSDEGGSLTFDIHK